MNEQQFEQALMATLSEGGEDYTSGEALDIEQVEQVQRFPVWTSSVPTIQGKSRQLVVTMKDGSQFQITIVKSKNSRD